MNHKNEITEWTRICPKCGGTIYHQSQKDRDRREREGRTCGGKANKDCKLISRAQRKKLSVALTGMVYEKVNGYPNKSLPPKWIRSCPRCSKVIGYHGRFEHYERAVKRNTVCSSCHTIIAKNTFADQMRNDPKKVLKMRATKAGFANWAEYKKRYPIWKQYKTAVWSETYKQLKRNPILENFDKRGKSGVDGAYQIDHINSVRYGFDHNIDPKIIGNYSNLQMLPWRDNLLKR